MLVLVGVSALSAPAGWAADPRGPGDPGVKAVLDQAPADAQVLIVVPSLARLGEKFATLNERLGLQHDQLDALLSEFKRVTGLTVGLNQDGPLMLTCTIRLPAAGDGEQAHSPSADLLALLPTADFTGLVENLGASLPDDGETVATGITLRTHHTAFIRQTGSFSVWGARRELVEGHRPGRAAEKIMEGLGQVGSRCLDRSDVVLIFRGGDKRHLLESLLDLMVLPLTAKVQKIAAEQAWTPGRNAQVRNGTGVGVGPGGGFGGGRSDAGAMIASNMTTKAFNRTGDALKDGESLLRDADTIAIGFDIDEGGIGLTGSIQFKDGSQMAEVIADGGGGAATLLARMPDRQFVFAYSVKFDGLRLEKLDRDRVQNLGMDQSSDWLGRTLFQVAATEGRAGGMTNVYYLPRAAGLAVGMTGVRIIETPDTAGFVAALRRNLEALNSTDDAGRQADADADDEQSGPKFKVEYDSRDMVVDGHRVDKYVISQQMMAVALNIPDAFPTMFGGDNFNTETTGYVVEVGRYVVITETTNTELLGSVLDAVKSDRGLGRDGLITESRDFLFQDLAFESYVDIGSILNSPQAAMAMMMLGQQFKPPVDLLPIAMGAAIEEHGIEARFFVPMSLLRFVKELVDRVSGQLAPVRNQTSQHRTTIVPAPPHQQRPAGLPFRRPVPPPGMAPVPQPPIPF